MEFAAMLKMTVSCIFSFQLIFFCIFCLERLAKCRDSA
jgi:hypothetical protein